MIFVTVGSQLPFDRLVHAVDRWAADTARDDVLAQVGVTEAPPSRIEWIKELDPGSFEERVAAADVLVGHAGTGTIMAALEAGKPVVILARTAAKAETRNDHQVATLSRFADTAGVYPASHEDEVGTLIERALTDAETSQSAGLSRHASGAIVERLRGFLDQHTS